MARAGGFLAELTAWALLYCIIIPLSIATVTRTGEFLAELTVRALICFLSCTSIAANMYYGSDQVIQAYIPSPTNNLFLDF